jgi:hypothetical protein
MCEKIVLRAVLGAKATEVKKLWRKPYNEKPHNKYCLDD